MSLRRVVPERVADTLHGILSVESGQRGDPVEPLRAVCCALAPLPGESSSVRTGNPQSRLVIVRGPSGSGKSTVAAELRQRMGPGTAKVEQDYVRRRLLKEKDTPGALNIGLLDAMVRHCLDGGYDVVVEGILDDGRYGQMLRALAADHAGSSVCAYLDVPFDETVRRHATRPQATEFTTDDMARWWVPDDVLGLPGEVVIGPASSAQETVARLLELVNGRAALKEARDFEPRPGATVPGLVERTVRPVT